jgi:hypothetical protein
MHGVIGLTKARSDSRVSFAPLGFCPPVPASRPNSIFHEHWWLDAVAPSSWREVTVEEGGKIVGRFPYFETRPLGFRVLGMPPLTRTLGPWVAEGAGKPVSRREYRRRVTAELIEKLPAHGFFRQLLPPSFDNLLSFQSAGFCVGIEHVVEIDGTVGTEQLWNGLHHKMRSLIRRADQQQAVEVLHDPEEFCRFYRNNIALKGRTLDFELRDFLNLFRACRDREACTILAMRGRDGALAAAIFLVWWEGRMHFLLQTRDPNIAVTGSVERLIWRAIEIAAQHSLVLDLDGIPNAKTAHRLLPFGGEIGLRAIATRGSALCMAARQFKKSLSWSMKKRSAVFC